MGPHLAIRVFVFVKSLILGLDIYELSDLIIFMTITNILKEKTKFKKKILQTYLVSVLSLNPSPFRAISDATRLDLYLFS